MSYAPESDPHSQNALEYKQEQIEKISQDLRSAIDLYGSTLTPFEKDNARTTVQANIEREIAKLAQSYLIMRTQRGEKITIQDMDDIMPYVRLTMLKELQRQISDKNSE